MFETDSGHRNRCLITSNFHRDPDWDWDTVIAQERVQ